jgi:spermidine synthase
MDPNYFLKAARVPESLKPQVFGLWQIRRVTSDMLESSSEKWRFVNLIGAHSQTALHRYTEATMHLNYGELVMEDSLRELRRHLPIWMNASGRVLVTGLGLGCVVRGLLASPAVEHITVVELDRHIIRVVGHEFQSNRRVRLVHGDALKVSFRGEKFDWAWHDLWTEDKSLQLMHGRVMQRFKKQVSRQGAWAFPRYFKRIMPAWYLP